jgi:hypothetical protein
MQEDDGWPKPIGKHIIAASNPVLVPHAADHPNRPVT